MPNAKPRCINLTDAEVREILANGRIILRRKIKPTPVPDATYWGGVAIKTRKSTVSLRSLQEGMYLDEYSPFGASGQELIGREAFIYVDADYCLEASVSIPVVPAQVVYRADKEKAGYGPWSRAAQMPPEYSRLRLVTRSVAVDVAAGEWVGELERIEVKNGRSESSI